MNFQKKFTVTTVIFAVILFLGQVVITYLIELHLDDHCIAGDRPREIEQPAPIKKGRGDPNDDFDRERRLTLKGGPAQTT
jgi:hypothetical protein